MTRARLEKAAPFLALCLGLLGAGTASASSNYPAEIQKQLSLSYTPACAICHQGGVTGYGTVTTAFGQAMRARGLVCCDVTSLDTALMALEGEMSPYITDLKEGLNPNDPGAGAVPQGVYGCEQPGRTSRKAAAGPLLVLLALWLSSRWRGLATPARFPKAG